MNTIKFWNIPDLISDKNQLVFDGDYKDLRLHSEERLTFGAKGKRLYKQAENKIDAIEYNGKGWQIYSTYDVSGFEYWMKKMEEPNRVDITIAFDTEDIDESELTAIEQALDNAIGDIYDISNEFDYDPSPYNA